MRVIVQPIKINLHIQPANGVERIVVVQQRQVVVKVGSVIETGGTTITRINVVTAVAIGGHRLVVLNSDGNAIYADSHNLTHAHKVLGITTGAASAGDTVTVQITGVLSEPSWTWTLDEPIWLGTNGILTQTPPEPTNGDVFSLIVGFPTAANAAMISIQQPILV